MKFNSVGGRMYGTPTEPSGMNSGSALGRMSGDVTPAGVIVRVNVTPLLTTFPAASEMLGRMTKRPATRGVPNNVVPANAKPGGSGVNGDAVMVYGGAPPATLNVNEYTAPSSPAGIAGMLSSLAGATICIGETRFV